MAGKLYGIGCGSGDPEDITRKALQAIKQCQVLFFPNKNQEDCVSYGIVKSHLEEFEKKELCFFDFPMTSDKNLLEKSHNEAAEKIIGYLNEGKSLAFITLGEPLLYSTFFYVYKKICHKGFEVEIINGISSVFSAAAKLGLNLTEGDCQLHIVPVNQAFNEAEVLKMKGNLVFMKAGKHLSSLRDFLLDNQGKIEFLGAVRRCSMKDEKIYRSLSDFSSEKDYLTIVFARIKEVRENHRFFQNTACKYFPCHKEPEQKDFNCLFCYCPLYFLGPACGGNFKYTEKGVKSCLACSYPHKAENYDEITFRLAGKRND